MPGYFTALLRYFNISGRSQRSEYWLFYLGFTIVMVAAIAGEVWWAGNHPGYKIGPIMVTVGVFHFVPSITVQLRRLHDIGKSGAWYLLTFIPFGGLVLLVWACFDSEEGSNAWGDNPKEERWQEYWSGGGRRSSQPPDRATEMIAKMNGRKNRSYGQFSS